ncbi:hypothetical protein TGGT1_363640 [Toxoplasma gondii GT1]|uniref:Uncharacterized protein n=2 Tax=Toxoplasma gondii TaxID=5811 RepID=A0A125YVQ2_TOXGV|nr:hypothetical protein TGGT1_363640 [Toxoplasma gondii GT1]ESS33490.1 hypothetical protein TGVEG_363640 [Toxoplasma gondii VEG]
MVTRSRPISSRQHLQSSRSGFRAVPAIHAQLFDESHGSDLQRHKFRGDECRENVSERATPITLCWHAGALHKAGRILLMGSAASRQCDAFRHLFRALVLVAAASFQHDTEHTVSKTETSPCLVPLSYWNPLPALEHFGSTCENGRGSRR